MFNPIDWLGHRHNSFNYTSALLHVRVTQPPQLQTCVYKCWHRKMICCLVEHVSRYRKRRTGRVQWRVSYPCPPSTASTSCAPHTCRRTQGRQANTEGRLGLAALYRVDYHIPLSLEGVCWRMSKGSYNPITKSQNSLQPASICWLLGILNRLQIHTPLTHLRRNEKFLQLL